MVTVVARIRAVLVVAALAAVHTALWRVPFIVAAPEHLDGPGLAAWLDATPSERVAGAALHVIALALTGYLVAVTMLGLLARLVRSGRAVTLTDRVTPRLLRALLMKAVPALAATAVIAQGGTAGAATGGGPGPVAPPVAVLSVLTEPSEPAGQPVATVADEGGGHFVIVAPATISLETGPPQAEPPQAEPPPAEPPPAEPPPAEPPPAEPPPTEAAVTSPAPPGAVVAGAPHAAERVHVVRRGEHFWSIAAATTAARLGRPATRTEVADYWLRLVEANRARLTDQRDANLLFAGQELVLPD